MGTGDRKIERGVIEELNEPGYFVRARQRAKRRKSPWNLILIPPMIVGIGFFWWTQFKLIWAIHLIIFPEHVGHFQEFWQAGISAKAFVSSFLMVIPFFFSSLPWGLMLANCVAWCVSPARRALDEEAKGVWHASFDKSMRDLGLAAAFCSVAAWILALVGALTLSSLR